MYVQLQCDLVCNSCPLPIVHILEKHFNQVNAAILHLSLFRSILCYSLFLTMAGVGPISIWLFHFFIKTGLY